jgi:UDP-N-acetylglucosamine--N-acetylmuramyl-(pentapeptide) pyrophosphoryl-undecaprenol N-acetylglucosamine transferase
VIAPVKRRTVVFAGGGTGGHLFPALAVARALPSFDSVFLVPGDRGDPDRLAGEFPCRTLDCPRPDRARWRYPAQLARAVAAARRSLRELEAAAVVGLGSYASIPASLAARSLGIPLYLMECNAVPGKATRLLARFAQGIGLGSRQALNGLKRRRSCRVTGTPLRSELRSESRPSDFGLHNDLPTLLVLGGSQGARGLNSALLEGLPACSDLEFQVLHCAGRDDAARMRAGYARTRIPTAVIDFVPDVGRVYAAADLVICRAGASTVAECAAVGLPAVFVPYPWHKDRQQERNALDAVAAGAARIVAQEDLDAPKLRCIVEEILLDETVRTDMAECARGNARPAAAQEMAAHLIESLGEAVSEPHWMAELGG